MKNFVILFCGLTMLVYKVQAQSLAINTSGATASPTSILDVSSAAKGVLIPRLSTAQRTGIAGPADGLLVYDTDSLAFSYYTGTGWVFLKGTKNIDSHWSTKGNTGTDTAVNFMGTIDSMPLRFKLNNTWAGQWDAKYGNYSIGSNAGNKIQPININSGGSNIAIGNEALSKNTTGGRNIAIGRNTLTENISGVLNIAVGIDALKNNTTGYSNIANGFQALYANTVGYNNIANSHDALFSNISGSNNIANGYTALYSNISGSNNIANGSYALNSNISGSNNIAHGLAALSENIDGINNIAMGPVALYHNTSGDDNIAFGSGALFANTTGYNNIATGYSALASNLTGYNNIAIGEQVLPYNTTGNNNIANGFMALFENVSGDYNIANGFMALMSNNVGNNNLAYGRLALEENTSGNNNIAIGARALEATTNTDNNTALGAFSLQTPTTGSNNTGLGYSSDVSLVSATNATALGYNATAPASNYVRIGNSAVTAIVGNVAFSPSDGRFKTNVQANVPGLSFIMGLRPVTYHFEKAQYSKHIGEKQDAVYTAQLQSQDIAGKTSTGFIAQEVEALAKKLNYDFDGLYKPQNDKDTYAIGYQQFVTPMIKAMQEQQSIITLQQAAIVQLQNDLKELKAKVGVNQQ
ncbi:MAG: tail fiber domain-containing protein [Ferruginibacter sp.]